MCTYVIVEDCIIPYATERNVLLAMHDWNSENKKNMRLDC